MNLQFMLDSRFFNISPLLPDIWLEIPKGKEFFNLQPKHFIKIIKFYEWRLVVYPTCSPLQNNFSDTISLDHSEYGHHSENNGA